MRSDSGTENTEGGGGGEDGIAPLVAGDPRRIGPYRLLGRLGSGGMGRVYLARSEGGRTVAVKVVHEEHASDGRFRARFRREVEAVRKVGGDFTAPVLDADPEADRPWVATGFVPGPSLEQVVRTHGPLPSASALALADGLLKALRGIHGAGILHRDLKPSNVMLTVEGPRVIDFGIARALEPSVESLLTSTGMVVGSPGFMAPEQVRGGALGPAADVFTLGCVLMYAVTGRLPFGHGAGNQHAIMFGIVEAEPELDRVTDDALRGVIARCLTKDPDERPGVETLLADPALSAAVTAEGSWLPPALVARLARQAARLLDAEALSEQLAEETAESRAARGSDALDGPDEPDAPDETGEGDQGGEAAAGTLRLRPGTAGSASDTPDAADTSGASGPSASSDTPDAGTLGLRPKAAVAATGRGGGDREPRRASRAWAVVAAVFAVIGISGTVVHFVDDDARQRDVRSAPGASGTTPPPSAGSDSASSAPPAGTPGTGAAPSQGSPPPGGADTAGDAGGAAGGGSAGTVTAGVATAGNSSSGSGSGNGSGSGSGTTSGSGSSGPGGSSGVSSAGSSAGTTKPPATADNQVPAAFVGTWAYAGQFNINQPATVYLYRVAPGQIAARMITDAGGAHCEHVAKLVSVTNGGKRVNLGTGTVDKARSASYCGSADPSYFELATPTGLRHDVGPAHGDGYHYERSN
ncbi:serine/threonine-protein kinase [Streptomyces sp. NPDC048577]|uniref:serine/threonine-protein kinase n=1 Tax=Streptomyces sp. NPDC048577 TaxID=3157209 RepID=UPI0034411FE0